MSDALPVDICSLPSMQCAFKEVMMAVVETRRHKQVGRFKYHYASVCANVSYNFSDYWHYHFFPFHFPSTELTCSS